MILQGEHKYASLGVKESGSQEVKQTIKPKGI